MSTSFPPKIVSVIAILLAVVFAGCSHQKTKRGHLFRCDWALEYNRTPWIGLPADSGYNEDEEGKSRGFFDCLKKDGGEKRKGFRRHCAMNAECSPQNPCCRTLGCGMWVDTADPTHFASLGGAAKACGLTPFCSPQKPCRLTPNCGKPTSVNPQALLFAGQQSANPANPMGLGTLTGRNFAQGNATGNAMLPHGMPMAAHGMPMAPNGIIPDGTLVSRGIVPGASAVTTGGMVAAIGVATPAGTMTPVGVRMPNGMVNNAIVLRACVASPNCTAARPCGLTPYCGGAVAVNRVANNAIALASALQAQGVAGGVMQAGGMGMLVNPMTNQPINGVTMSGMPQAGYPPIGYAPTGYAPGYPRYAAGLIDAGGEPAEEMPEEAEAVLPETRSAMPVPRYHPIPHKPTFQRSEGMPTTPPAPRTAAKPATVTMREEPRSEAELEMALDQAYLEGVSAAMDEVERTMEAKRQAAARAKLQEKILQQAETLQQQFDDQEELRMLALQQERKLRQQQQTMRAEMLVATEMASEPAVSEPKRLPVPTTTPPSPTVASTATSRANRAAPAPTQSTSAQSASTQSAPAQSATHQANRTAPVPSPLAPTQLAGTLKTSVTNGVSSLLNPFLGSNQKAPQQPARQQPRQTAAATTEMVAVTPPNLPGRPPVLPMTPGYGLLPDDDESFILQARFAEDDMPIKP